MSQPAVNVAVPNKGRLSEQSLELLHRAGIRLDYSHERKLHATSRDGTYRVLFVRARDVPEFVQDGVADAGITGLDIVRETERNVDERLDLGFGACRLVVAVPEGSPIQTDADVPPGARVATSFPNLARGHFKRLNLDVDVVEVSGATEITPHIGVADVIVDLTSTGSTLAMNHLREVGTILESTARLVANPTSLEAEATARPLRELEAGLRSVVAARGKRYLMVNVPPESLDEAKKALPGLNGPTVLDIADHGMKAVHAVVDEADVFRTVNRLKELGGEGILVLPVQRLVP